MAVIVLVVIVGFPLFGPPRENGYCTLSMLKKPQAIPEQILRTLIFRQFMKIISEHLEFGDLGVKFVGWCFNGILLAKKTSKP